MATSLRLAWCLLQLVWWTALPRGAHAFCGQAPLRPRGVAASPHSPLVPSSPCTSRRTPNSAAAVTTHAGALFLTTPVDSAAAAVVESEAVEKVTSALTAGDPTLVLAASVALVALVGLLVTSLAGTTTDSVTDPLSRILTPTDDAPKPTVVVDSSSSSTSETSRRDERESRQAAQALANEDYEAFSAGTEDDDNDNNDNDDIDMQDVTAQAKEAMEAFTQDDRSRLRTILGGLVGSIRTARAAARDERTLRLTAQADVTAVGESLRELEDQYELGQNQLTKTQGQLRVTQTELAATQRTLVTTSTSLTELQDERKSLRKLGRVAWQLSKARVGARLPRRFRSSHEEGDDDTTQD